MPALLELFLERIQVVENGREEDEEGVNALAATLYYPRENVPSVTAVRSLWAMVQDNVPLDYTRHPLHDRLLFKEVIRGSCMIELTLSATTHASRLDSFLHRVFGAAWMTGVGTMTAGMGALPAAILGQASASLFELATPEDEITIIGQGRYPIREGMTEARIPVQLALLCELESRKTETRDGERVQVKRTLPAGFGNAQVTVAVKWSTL